MDEVKDDVAMAQDGERAEDSSAEVAQTSTEEAAQEDDTMKNIDTEEVAENETAEAEGEDEGAQDGKKKRKLPKFIQNIVTYLKAHEDVRQMVLFFLFSIICGASQLIITYALSAGLKLEAHLGHTRLDWFVFHYATQAEFIGFLVGSVVGQVLTFVLNRKKTFNVPNYIALRAVLYAIMAIIIIIMQTYLGGLITDACWKAKPDANGFLDLVFNLTGQAVAGIAALIVNFLGNKFFIMRDWGGKKKKAALEAAADVQEPAEEATSTAIEDNENATSTDIANEEAASTETDGAETAGAIADSLPASDQSSEE